MNMPEIKTTLDKKQVSAGKFTGLMIEGENFNYIQRHKVDNKPNLTIWIVREHNEDDKNIFSFDINVYDEDNNERADELEMSHIDSYDEALKNLQQIVNENNKLHFIRISDRDNTWNCQKWNSSILKDRSAFCRLVFFVQIKNI